MAKIYFHNSNLISENIIIKKSPHFQNVDQSRTVDINKLLNRVKLEKKKEIKQKIIFFSIVIFGIGLMGSLMAIIKLS